MSPLHIDPTVWYSLATTSGAITLLGLSYFIYKRNYPSLNGLDESEESLLGQRSTRPRAISINSSQLVDGVFPKSVQEPPCIININLLFKELPSDDELVTAFTALLQHERFRCCPVYDKTVKGYRFKYIHPVDIKKNHLYHLSVESEEEALKRIEEISISDMTDLYNKHPLWQIYKIENKGKGMNILLLRIHHAISDGIGLIGAISQIFTNPDTNEPLQLDIPQSMKGAKGVGSKNILYLAVRSLVSAIYVLSLAVLSFDSNILFTDPNKKRLVSSKKRIVVLFPNIQLDFLKTLKNKAGVTLNDVVFSATSGAILRYCQARNDPLLSADSSKRSSVSSRALLPVAFPRTPRELENNGLLRNKWAFVSVSMPLNESNAINRLRKCNETTQSIKSSPAPFCQYFIQNKLLPFAPTFLARQTALDLIARHSLVYSNLPGPESPIDLCGKRLFGLQVVFNNIVPQVILVSYGGSVFCNMTIDSDIVKDGEKLLPKFYLEELKELAKSLGVSCEDDVMLSSPADELFGSISSS